MSIDLLAELNICTRCGFCQDVCPTYKAERTEGSVARGRIRLAKIVEEGNYTWNRRSKINQYINDCLLCGACVSVCPGSIPTNELMIRARQKINQSSGFSLIHKVVYKGVLCDQKKLKLSRKLLRFYQAIGISSLLRSTKVLGVVPMLKALEERLPDVPRQSVYEIVPNLLVDMPNPTSKLGFFCGCATNSFYSNVAVSAVNVLQKMNYKLSFPQVQCCGEPQRSIGDLNKARELAKQNIDIFVESSCDYILTDCATCGSALKNYHKLLADDEEYREKSKIFSSMIYDLNEFIVEKSEILKELNPVANQQQIKVTYHDPCHQVRGQHITSAPREVLKSIPGVEFIEMEEPDACCGGAGAYGFTHNHLSQKILKAKMNDTMATGANYLATSCPACMMQLGYGIKHNNLDLKLVHPIQLLELALNN